MVTADGGCGPLDLCDRRRDRFVVGVHGIEQIGGRGVALAHQRVEPFVLGAVVVAPVLGVQSISVRPSHQEASARAPAATRTGTMMAVGTDMVVVSVVASVRP